MKNYIKIALAVILTLTVSASHADLNVYEETSVVEVVNSHKRLGTAFAVGKNHLLTADHVVEGQPELLIVYRGRRYVCSVVPMPSVAKYYDTAVLYAHGASFHNPLSVARSVNIGDPVRVYGFPAGAYYSRTDGVVTSFNETVMHWWATRDTGKATAKVRPGYSGGPVVNRDTNEVVGILTNHETPTLMELFRGESDFDALFTRCDQLHSFWGKPSRR